MHHFRNCAFYEPAMQVLCGKEKAIFVMSHDFEKYVHLFPFCQEVQSDWRKKFKSSLSVTIVTLTIKYTCCKRCNFYIFSELQIYWYWENTTFKLHMYSFKQYHIACCKSIRNHTIKKGPIICRLTQFVSDNLVYGI